MLQLNLILSFSLLFANPMGPDASHSAQRYYSVILYQITDEAKYAEYRSKTKPFFVEVGARLERELQLSPSQGKRADIGPFNRALVVSYKSAAEPRKVRENPAFQKYEALLKASTERVVTLSGISEPSFAGKPSNNAFFIIKLGWLQKHADKERMAQEVAPINQSLAPFGFAEDRVIYYPETTGFKKSPTKVTVMFFGSFEQQQNIFTNPDLRNSIQSFNKKWFEDTMFIGGTALKK